MREVLGTRMESGVSVESSVRTGMGVRLGTGVWTGSGEKEVGVRTGMVCGRGWV